MFNIAVDFTFCIITLKANLLTHILTCSTVTYQHATSPSFRMSSHGSHTVGGVDGTIRGQIKNICSVGFH